MSSEISASVGRWEKGARNLQDDVRSVQRLLKTAAEILGRSGNRSKRSGRKDLTTISNVRDCGGDRSLSEPFHQCGGRNYCARQPDVGHATGSFSKKANSTENISDSFSMALPFSYCSNRKLGKTTSARSHPRGLVVLVYTPAVIFTFPEALRSTPSLTVLLLEDHIHFTVKLLPWRLIMDLSSPVTERSKARQM